MILKGRETVQESKIFNRMLQKEDVSKIIISYNNSPIGKCVLVFEGEKFTRLQTVNNNTKLLCVEELSYERGLSIIEHILIGDYNLNGYKIVTIEETGNSEFEDLVAEEGVVLA